MREFMALFEAADDIQKRGIDNRDLMQKYQDIIDHPNTEEYIREVARRKLKKMQDAQAKAAADAAASAEYHAKDSQVPALNIQVSFQGKPLPPERWGEVYLHGNGKVLRFQQVLDRILPLQPFRIDFSAGTGQFVGDMTVHVWFHPEDEPPLGGVRKAMEAKPSILAKASDDAAKYFRGGMSQYYIFFYDYKHKPKGRR